MINFKYLNILRKKNNGIWAITNEIKISKRKEKEDT